MNNQKQTAYIAINHLSPNRHLRHFKEKEDLKVMMTQTKFQRLDNQVKEHILMTEHQPLNVNNLTEEQVSRLVTSSPSKKSLYKRKPTSNQLKLLSMFRNLSSQNLAAKNDSSTFSKVGNHSQSAVDVTLMATVKHPQNTRIKKYNELVSYAITQGILSVKEVSSNGQLYDKIKSKMTSSKNVDKLTS